MRHESKYIRCNVITNRKEVKKTKPHSTRVRPGLCGQGLGLGLGIGFKVRGRYKGSG